MINRQGRATTGTFTSAQAGIVVRDEGLRPAISLVNKKQHRYRFRLLAGPRSQLTRDILPVPLREREDQAQPGELSVGDDD